MEALIIIFAFTALSIGGAESLRDRQHAREIEMLDKCIDNSTDYESQDLCFKVFNISKEGKL